MSNTSTAKPTGISQEEYKKAQDLKAEEDFKYNTNQCIQNLRIIIDGVNKSLNNLIALVASDKVDADTQISDVAKVNELGFHNLRQRLGDQQTELKEVSERLEKLDFLLKDCVVKSDHEKHLSFLQDLIQEIRREKDVMCIHLKTEIQNLRSHFDSKLNAQREEVLNRPSDIPDLRKEFDKKLELVELNGQNSILRSSNNEKQILLVERKIENIYQLIKKIELSK